MGAFFPIQRLRRRRESAKLRSFFEETRLSTNDLILPVFVTEKEKRAITSIPGHHHWPTSELPRFIKQISEKGIGSVILFGIPSKKDPKGTSGYSKDGIIPNALSVFKKENPDILLIADICLCEYTDHGHCGVVDPEKQTVDNDKTLPLLASTALCYAQAGADIVAPSDMLDGRVQAIRQKLDQNGLTSVPIMSYAAKFASSFYGPFRDAAESTPQRGDRRGYQMNPANFNEAIEEIRQDVNEGADAIIVKPAITCLDIIHAASRECTCPVIAYQVSGEYCMIHAASDKGWLDRESALRESLISIKRAGAHRIISYFSL